MQRSATHSEQAPAKWDKPPLRLLVVTLRRDLLIQVRQGFIAASALVMAVMLAVLQWLPQEMRVPIAPVLIFGELFMGTFFFVAALLILEKEEGSLAALAVSPLPFGIYLGSKALILTGIVAAESFLLVVLGLRVPFDPWALLAGVAGMGMIMTLLGFLAAARHDSVNTFLFPSMLWVTALILPFPAAFGLAPDWATAWHPVAAGMGLLQGAFVRRPWIGILADIALLVIWTSLLAWLCGKAYRRWIVQRGGWNV
ncbi:MAG TPA: ABC transporter permease [Acidobacteriota bacterium]|nr:ABC transporter permease [Acidobacteriota bacterium]